MTNLTDFNLGKMAVLSVMSAPMTTAQIESKVREIGPMIGVGNLLTQLMESGYVDRLRDKWVISDSGVEVRHNFRGLTRRI